MDLFWNRRQERKSGVRGMSRRSLGRMAAMISAAAALPLYNESALAQLSAIAGPLPPDAVKINANENPLGPCPEALDAIERFAWDGGRYHYEQTAALRDLLAAQEGLEPEYVEPYPGSSAPLYQSVLALCSPSKPFVTADPGYEAGERAAKFSGARVIRVPLPNRYSHDVRKMATASPSAGLIYLCNPNNPTGTLTSPSDIEWLVENKPKGTTVLVDEAYLHFTNAPACSGLVARDRDVIVLRTFSKLYGMAGLRAGAAFRTCWKPSASSAPARCPSQEWWAPSPVSSPKPSCPSAARLSAKCARTFSPFSTNTISVTSPRCRTTSCSMSIAPDSR
jgi:histidinol-phosphate aminotransferase